MSAKPNPFEVHPKYEGSRPTGIEMSVTTMIESSDLEILFAELKKHFPHESASLDCVATMPIVSSETSKDGDGMFTHSFVFGCTEEA